MTNCPISSYQITAPSSGIVFYDGDSACSSACNGVKSCQQPCNSLKVSTGNLITYSLTIEATMRDSTYPAGAHSISATKVVHVVCGPSSVSISQPSGLMTHQQDLPGMYNPRWLGYGFKPSVINTREADCPIQHVYATNSDGSHNVNFRWQG